VLRISNTFHQRADSPTIASADMLVEPFSSTDIAPLAIAHPFDRKSIGRLVNAQYERSGVTT
jgi:hypothetical protein